MKKAAKENWIEHVTDKAHKVRHEIIALGHEQDNKRRELVYLTSLEMAIRVSKSKDPREKIEAYADKRFQFDFEKFEAKEKREAAAYERFLEHQEQEKELQKEAGVRSS